MPFRGRTPLRRFTTVIGVLAGVAGCGPTVEHFEGSAYLFVREPASWSDARNDCVAQGYDLVAIQTDRENQWIADAAYVYQRGRWWIGLSDRDTEGTWVWTTGDPMTYSAFPDYGLDDDGDDCAVLGSSVIDTGYFAFGGGDWFPVPCNATASYVCERAEGAQP